MLSTNKNVIGAHVDLPTVCAVWANATAFQTCDVVATSRISTP